MRAGCSIPQFRLPQSAGLDEQKIIDKDALLIDGTTEGGIEPGVIPHVCVMS